MKLAEMILFLGIFVVMPVIIVALVTRAKTNATNKRAEIALAAIEKNSDVNLEVLQEDESSATEHQGEIVVQVAVRLHIHHLWCRHLCSHSRISHECGGF